MTIPVMPIVVCVVGLVMYALADTLAHASPQNFGNTRAKVTRVGEIAFAVGLFWTVAILAATGSIRL